MVQGALQLGGHRKTMKCLSLGQSIVFMPTACERETGGRDSKHPSSLPTFVKTSGSDLSMVLQPLACFAALIPWIPDVGGSEQGMIVGHHVTRHVHKLTEHRYVKRIYVNFEVSYRPTTH